jgi:hypothetical protein
MMRILNEPFTTKKVDGDVELTDFGLHALLFIYFLSSKVIKTRGGTFIYNDNDMNTILLKVNTVL